MAHPNWCGRPCWRCAKPCELDTSIPCSPDCEGLNNTTGEPDSEVCLTCDALRGEHGSEV